MKLIIADWDKHREVFVRNALRKVSMFWPAGTAARHLARTERKTNVLSGKQAWHARCAMCGTEAVMSSFELDHVEPVVPVDRDYSKSAYGPEQLGQLVQRMLPEPQGYQLLCHDCHAKKTAGEVETRTENRRRHKALKNREEV